MAPFLSSDIVMPSQPCLCIVSDFSCASAYCDADNRCQPRVPIGSPCSGTGEDQICQGGYCSNSENKCVADRAEGAPCTRNLQCGDHYTASAHVDHNAYPELATCDAQDSGGSIAYFCKVRESVLVLHPHFSLVSLFCPAPFMFALIVCSTCVPAA